MEEKSSRKWKLEKKEKSSKKMERKREWREGDERRVVRRRWKGKRASLRIYLTETGVGTARADAVRRHHIGEGQEKARRRKVS